MITAILIALMVANTAPIDVPLDHDVIIQEEQWDGVQLNAEIGVVQGPSGKETYYNLPIDGVVFIMRSAGYSEENYPYWVRDDGVKMLGGYVILAADQRIRPLGTVLPTSLGYGIVCDTGDFIYNDSEQIDIAVTW